MSIRLEFDIEFKSDFHIGAGHGLGLQVDSALLRDPDNVPVIRGTVLTGLLRESLMNLFELDPFSGSRRCEASGLKTDRDHAFCGQFAPDEADCPVCAIFGSPRRMKHWHISSARPADLVAPQMRSQDWRAGETAAQVATRVRVNPKTRRAEDNKLFSREEGDGSLRFRFVAECLRDDETAWQEAEWLLAAARMLRNLGAGKRRGYGECEIHLVDRAQEANLLDRFEKRLIDEPVGALPVGTQTAVTPLTLPPNPGEHTYRLRVLLRTDEPLLIARRAEAGNQFETMESIPGSVLRGALAWRLARQAGSRLDDCNSVEYQNFAAFFFHNAVRFSALLPVERNTRDQGYVALPAPRDLLTCELHPGFDGKSRDEGHGVWSLLRGDDRSECPICAIADDASDRQPAAVKLESVSGYVSLLRGGRSKFKPKQTSEMHIRLDPESGRVRSGDLFGYVSLEPGQHFVGEITCTNETVWQALQQMAGLEPQGKVNNLRLGKAARRGHGKASVVFQTAKQSPWQAPGMAERVKSVDEVVMLLPSDAIVADPWGRYLRGFDADWITRELGLPEACTVTIDTDGAGEDISFSVVRPVDAFNAKLGLPRARDIALAAGSCVRLSFAGIELAELVKILEIAENQGIGLRRDEGFGRVAFNHPVHDKNLSTWSASALDLSPLVLGDNTQRVNPATALIQFMLDWMKKLDDEFKSGASKFSDERFEAVARLLHVSRKASADDVKQELDRMGKMEELLPQTLKGRDKKNFFETDGENGMKAIKRLVGEMATQLEQQGLAENPQAWRIALQMLAARIAELARQKAQERR